MSQKPSTEDHCQSLFILEKVTLLGRTLFLLRAVCSNIKFGYSLPSCSQLSHVRSGLLSLAPWQAAQQSTHGPKIQSCGTRRHMHWTVLFLEERLEILLFGLLNTAGKVSFCFVVPRLLQLLLPVNSSSPPNSPCWAEQDAWLFSLSFATPYCLGCKSHLGTLRSPCLQNNSKTEQQEENYVVFKTPISALKLCNSITVFPFKYTSLLCISFFLMMNSV